MKEKFILVENLQIAYVEENPGASNIIFFIHGNSGSSKMWHKQLETEKLSNYRLIAIDLPGHGRSAASKNPMHDYGPIATTKILARVVMELSGINSYILTGFSYGSNLVAEMLNYDINPRGIILAGACVLGDKYGMEQVFVQSSTPSILFYNEPDNKVVEDFFRESMHSADGKDLQNSIQDYVMVSADFKPAVFQAVGEISDEILALKKYGVSSCVIFGEEDKLVNIDYLDSMPFPVWRNHIFKLPAAGHWVGIDKPNEFNQIIFEYIQEVFIQGHA
jgi:Predicted hydrolases or acyltransferases (alpha/beta hydrolase superfamily)